MDAISENIFHIENLYTENSRKLASEIANDTACEILKELYKNPSSITDISNKLGIPLSTVHYHIDKLVELGIIKVAKRRLGKRLRDVKMYVQDKEGIIFLSIEKNEFDSLLKAFTIQRIKEKAPVIALLIFGSGLVLSLLGSWLLKREIEATATYGGIAGSAVGRVEINIGMLLVFFGLFFLLGSVISFILVLFVMRMKK